MHFTLRLHFSTYYLLTLMLYFSLRVGISAFVFFFLYLFEMRRVLLHVVAKVSMLGILLITTAIKWHIFVVNDVFNCLLKDAIFLNYIYINVYIHTQLYVAYLNTFTWGIFPCAQNTLVPLKKFTTLMSRIRHVAPT